MKHGEHGYGLEQGSSTSEIFCDGSDNQQNCGPCLPAMSPELIYGQDWEDEQPSRTIHLRGDGTSGYTSCNQGEADCEVYTIPAGKAQPSDFAILSGLHDPAAVSATAQSPCPDDGMCAKGTMQMNCRDGGRGCPSLSVDTRNLSLLPSDELRYPSQSGWEDYVSIIDGSNPSLGGDHKHCMRETFQVIKTPLWGGQGDHNCQGYSPTDHSVRLRSWPQYSGDACGSGLSFDACTGEGCGSAPGPFTSVKNIDIRSPGYNILFNEMCPTQSESEYIMQKLGGTPNIDPIIIKRALNNTEGIHKMIKAVDKYYLDNGGIDKDTRYIINKEELIDLIGMHATLTLLNILNTSFNDTSLENQEDYELKITIRRMEPEMNKAQHFHLDLRANGIGVKTMQVPLNDDYKGGKIIYLNNKTIIPERDIGDGILHTHEIVHGVSELTEGIRYSLFIQYKYNPKNITELQDKMIKEVGAHVNIVDKYLKINNNNIDKAIDQFYNDK